MKVCFKCKEKKPAASFYRHSMMADGRLGKCKDCTRRDVRQRRLDRPKSISEYERKRSKTAKRKAQIRETQRRRRKAHPEKTRAYGLVRRAVLNGSLVKKPCRCGSKRVQAHHADYSKPLEVVWVCFKCHREDEHGQVVVSKISGKNSRIILDIM